VLLKKLKEMSGGDDPHCPVNMGLHCCVQGVGNQLMGP